MDEKRLANLLSQPSGEAIDLLSPDAAATLTSRGAGFSHAVSPVSSFQKYTAEGAYANDQRRIEYTMFNKVEQGSKVSGVRSCAKGFHPAQVQHSKVKFRCTPTSQRVIHTIARCRIRQFGPVTGRCHRQATFPPGN